MSKDHMATLVPFWVLGIILIGSVNMHNNNTLAYAHSFSPNSLSTFVSRAIEADVELSLANNNFPSNITLALDHSKNAAELINVVYHMDDDIIDDIDFIRKYNDALNSRNTTIQALVIANMNMMTTQTTSLDTPNSPFSSPSYSMNMPVNSNIEAEINNDYTNVVNVDNYQSAQKLSEKVFQVFKNQLRPLALSPNHASKSAMNVVEKSLFDLKYLIDNKASAQDIMGLVHGKLH